MPESDVAYLSASPTGLANSNNASFNAIEIEAGSVPSGQTLALNVIGTATTANLVYVIAGAFTVSGGGSMTVAPNVAVQIGANQSLSDSGSLSFGLGDSVTYESVYGSNTVIAVGGALTAYGTSFSSTGGNTSQLNANSGGQMTLTYSSISVSALNLNSGSTDTMSGNVLSTVFTINSYTTLNVTSNDFTNIAANGVVAAGDSTATIQLASNYWGSSNAATIEAKIVDHTTHSNLPSINFQPFLKGSSGTLPASLTVPFATTNQTFNLTATVTSPGNVVNEGTETFSIFNGTTQVGQTTTPVNVSNGAVTAAFTLPGNTPAGKYAIVATYTDSGANAQYLGATNSSQFLTVGQGTTTTTVQNASGLFNAASDQSIPFTATVGSTSGMVNEGVVTFSVLSGATMVGSSVVGTVSGGTATATYILKAGTGAANYKIQAVYSDPASFTTSTGTATLSNSAATTVVSAVNTSTAFSTASQNVTLSAGVGSAGGTVAGGTVTFTIYHNGNLVASTSPAAVSNSAASATLVLPPSTAALTYTIQAAYSGNTNFAPSTDSSHTLTVTPLASTTTVTNASGVYDTLAPVSATVLNGTTPLNEGSVVFSIMQGTTTLASTSPINVLMGNAATNFALPSGVAAGTYSLVATFSDSSPGDYSTSFSDGTLTVTPANQSITFTGVPSTEPYGATFHVNPTSTSGLPVVLTAGSNCVVVASGGGGYDITMTSGSLNATFTASQPGDGNYNAAADVSRTVTAQKALATVNLSNVDVTYNGSAQFASAVTSPAGLTVNLVYTQGTTVVPSPTLVGNYSVTATISDFNYQGTATGTLTIEKAAASISFNAASLAQTYDGTSKIVTAATVPAGLLVTYGFTQAGNTASPVGAGSYVVTATVNDPNYQGTVTSTLVIARVDLTVIANAQTVTYDGSTFAGFAASFAGFVHGEGVSALYGSPGFTGTAVSAVNAGTYTLTPVLGTLGAANYDFTVFQSASLTINQASLTVVADAATKVYDGSPFANFSAHFTGFVGGDGAGVISGSPSFGDAGASAFHAGTYSVAPGVGTLSALNYTFTSFVAGTLSITQVLPSITWPKPSDILYGTPLSTTQLDASTSIAGTFTYSHAAGTILDAGTNQALIVTFTPTDTVDVASSSLSVSINVTQAAPTFAGLTASQSIVFGQPTLTVTGVLSSATAIPVGETVTVTIGSASSTAIVGLDGSIRVTIDISNLKASASSYVISYDFTGGIDFVGVSDSSTTLTIARANSIVTWNDPSDIVYGTVLSSVQLNAIDTVAGTITYSPALGTLLNAGSDRTLSATFMPSDATDYNAVPANVSINVIQAQPGFAGLSASQSISFGTPTITVSGKIAATTAIPSGTVSIAVGSITVTANINVDGTFTQTLDVHTLASSTTPYAITYTFAGNANFVETVDASTALTVGKALPGLTWVNPPDIVYGTALAVAELDASASVPGTFTYSPTLGAILLAGGSQTLTVNFVPTDTTEYASTSTTVVLNVLKAQPSFTTLSASQSITFGAPTITVSGVLVSPSASLGGEQVTITIGTASAVATLAANGSFTATISTGSLAASASPYAITYSYSGDANLKTSVDGSTTLTIAKAVAKASWINPADIAYGTPLSAIQLDATDVVPGTFTYTPALGTVLGVGSSETLTATFTPTDSTDYASTTASAIINVSQTQPIFGGLTASQSIAFGTATIVLAGKLSATGAIPGGEHVTIAIGTASTSATIQADGTFTATISTIARAPRPPPTRSPIPTPATPTSRPQATSPRS